MSHDPIQEEALTSPESPPCPGIAEYDICRFIIAKPEKQRLGQKLIFGSLTLIFWGAWSFLWQPLANMIGWSFGFYAFYEHLVVLQGWHGVVSQLPIYLEVVEIMGGALILWALINWGRFSGKERRRARQAVDHEAMAEWLAQPTDKIAAWQQAQRLVVHYDSTGGLIEVTSKRAI